MRTLREQYHDVGNKVNTALMGVTIARKYMESLKGAPEEAEIIADSIAGLSAAEKSLLELDGSLLRLKSISYRFTDPDAEILDQETNAQKKNAGVAILVVDDEPEVCGLVKRICEKRGFRVTAALGGEEAIGRIRETKPDIVLLDLHLNGTVDGVDVLTFLRREMPATRCMIITGEDSPSCLKEVSDLGPDDVLIKPVLAAQLYAKVNGLVAGLKK